MKKIEIIPIAKKKIKGRGIPEEWITDTLNSPMQIVDGYGGRSVAQRKLQINENRI